MKSIYEKRGRTARFERIGLSEAFIVAKESGRATIERGRFEAETLDEAVVVAETIDPSSLRDRAIQLARTLERPLVIERLTLVAGSAEHSLISGKTTRRWSENTARLHVAVAHRTAGIRVLIDVGGESIGSIDFDEVAVVATALRNCGDRSSAVDASRVLLAPAVAAALAAELAVRASSSERISSVDLHQVSHPAFPRDGNGQKVRELDLLSGLEWPNVYRPSYRAAPRLRPFHVELQGAPLRRVRAITAVALVRPVETLSERLSLSVLFMDDHGRSFAGRLSMSRAEWFERIEGTSDDRRWYPYSAGAWGSTTAVRDVAIAKL